ncbi:MAG: aminoglycoside phosphotransferase family protein [Phycisphaerales bacterium]|nr:MAG: aminoglycoside phosphotransferase family protein [Phycisphaerales bacterium]
MSDANTPPGPLPQTGRQSAGALGAALEPVLRDFCNGKLSEVAWFRADWQRGGAATGYATWAVEPGDEREVVVKLPVGPTEHRFTVGLAATDAPTPRVVAHGQEVGGYDLAWIVMERLPGDPLAAALHKEVFADLAEACAAFQRHAGALWPITGDERRRADPDWGALLETARAAAKDSQIPHFARWNDAIKHTQKALPRMLAAWTARPITTWRHGDLHAGNAMRRPEGSPWGAPGCVLLDFAEVQPGHWVEDAVYLERMHWGRKDALDGVKPVSLLAKARRNAGMDTEGDYGVLANIRRVLTAASIPAFLDREGTPSHLNAALETLERLLPTVGK